MIYFISNAACLVVVSALLSLAVVLLFLGKTQKPGLPDMAGFERVLLLAPDMSVVRVSETHCKPGQDICRQAGRASIFPGTH